MCLKNVTKAPTFASKRSDRSRPSSEAAVPRERANKSRRCFRDSDRPRDGSPSAGQVPGFMLPCSVIGQRHRPACQGRDRFSRNVLFYIYL